MKNIFEKIYQKLDKTADKIPSDVDDKNRRLFYFVFLIIGPPAMILFGVNGLLQGDVVLFSSLMVLAVGVITGWFILLKQEKGLFVYRINAGVYAIILIYAVYLGGQGGSKILWSYTFPLIVIFLFGKKEGLLWCILYYLGVSAIIFPEWNLHSKHTYSSEFTLRFTFTFFIN